MRLELQKEHNDNNAVKVKTWGDALKNAIVRMPNEPVEVIAWFINLERLFDQLKIPSELQAILIRPYWNERAKSLLARCDPSRSADYFAIKKFLLQKLHLSPSVYLEKFQSVKYDRNETYNQFSTKLQSLFEYCVESRKIHNNYDKLVELMVYDRMKCVLPHFLARHVLTLESAHENGWLGLKPLAEALDTYVANMQADGRPRLPQAKVVDGSNGDKKNTRDPKATIK